MNKWSEIYEQWAIAHGFYWSGQEGVWTNRGGTNFVEVQIIELCRREMIEL